MKDKGHVKSDVDVTCLFIKETGQDVYDYVL